MKENIKNLYLKNGLLIVVLFVILYGLILAGVLNRYYTTILVLISVAIIVGTSLNLASGMLGQLVLGHAAFMAMGAYGAALTGMRLFDMGLPNLLIFIISAIVGGLVAAVTGLLVGTPALRLKGDYLGIMTLGFGEIVIVFLTNIPSITGGAQGLKGIPRIMTFPIAYWTMVIVVTIIVFVMNSRHGRAILSIRENEIAAEAVGIDLTKYKIITFSLAAFLAGVGGAVYAFQQGFLAPTTTAFGFMRSVEFFVIVVLGGMGSISGTIISASVLTFLPEALRQFASYRLLVYSIVLIVMMLFRPQGLLGHKELNVTAMFDRAMSSIGLGKKKDGDQ